ncbi:MAG: MBL fold metallo-hydrolase [Prevotellaceae bacterium]|nr:MBL fold metallo-hydrolase [Prevotellaceae bacterium]
MKITFLGTGTSVGVPTIGCKCEVCRSTDLHDKRLRCSAIVESETTRILIDCGPDFRQQMLDREFKKLDAVFLTHIHYDHVGGLDDLRPFCQFGEINIYADKLTSDGLMHTMPYCFEEHRYPGVPKINLHTIKPHVALRIGDIDVMPVQVIHGKVPILGYRFGDLLYITDMKTVNESEFQYFKGIKTLVVNALRFKPDHHSHQTVDEAISFIRKTDAERSYLIHINHDMGLHDKVNALLPEDINLAFDGLTLNL